jgi:hypothetical protein
LGDPSSAEVGSDSRNIIEVAVMMRVTGSPPNHAGTGGLAGNRTGSTCDTSAMVKRRATLTA